MALSAERGPHALGRNVPAPPLRHPRGRLRPRLWGAGPTFALVILQAAVFAVSGCLLAPFDISHPGGSAWAFALPAPAALPPSVLAMPDRPSRGEQVRTRVVLPVSAALRTSGVITSSGAVANAAAAHRTDTIEPVGFTVLPAALAPRGPDPVAGPGAPHVPVAGPAAPHVPVAGPAAQHVPATSRKAHRKAGHRHVADHRARDHKHRDALLARGSLPHARHGSAPPPGATHREAC